MKLSIDFSELSDEQITNIIDIFVEQHPNEFEDLTINAHSFELSCEKVEEKQYAVLLGNFTFHHFEAEELELFKTDNENKALIHEIEEIKFFNSKEDAYEEVDNTHHLSWIIPSEFNGEVAFENEKELKKVSNLFG